NLERERMLFFDFSPSGPGKVGAYNVRFHIYTITGEAAGGTAWKMVLKGVDGVVFVADSAPDRLGANLESLSGLRKILEGYGINLADLPGVLQCNKRDLSAALPLEEMQAAMNPGGYPVMPAVAGKGEGVLESLYSLMKNVLKNLRERGLELDKEPEQLAAANAMVSGAGETVAGLASGPIVTPEAEPAAAASAENEDNDLKTLIELAGEPVALPDGGLRLPLSLRHGPNEKKITLTVTVTPGPDPKA
ncbi:MAG TPA: ADP-ribosylation factor-like protein, partial [Geobacteraceae bacterium]